MCLLVTGHRCIVPRRVTTLKLCSCWLSTVLVYWLSHGTPNVKLRSTNAVLIAQDLTIVISSLKVITVPFNAIQSAVRWVVELNLG